MIFVLFSLFSAVAWADPKFMLNDPAGVAFGAITGKAVANSAAPVQMSYQWENVFLPCNSGYWKSGCGQAEHKVKGTVKCVEVSRKVGDPPFIFEIVAQVADSLCTSAKPAATMITCPATPPCPRCKGCQRNGACWQTCKKPGFCSSCDSRDGRAGACCKPGSATDPVECKVAQFQFSDATVHTCAVLPGDAVARDAILKLEQRVQILEDDVNTLKLNAPPGTFTPAAKVAVTPGAYDDVSWFSSPSTVCHSVSGISWFNTLADAQKLCLDQGKNKDTGEPICGGVQLTAGCKTEDAFGNVRMCIGTFSYFEDTSLTVQQASQTAKAQALQATCTLKHEYTLAFLYGW